jgi:hypothetical protein
MSYRTFERTWWLDNACTKPGAGEKTYTGDEYEDETEAVEACREANLERGPTRRGPRGLATEYEEC